MGIHLTNRQRLQKINTRRIRRDSLWLLRKFSLTRAELGILLVNDSRMHTLNLRYRGIDKTTDVLSFPLYSVRKEIPDDGIFLLGDIVINLHAAGRQAREAACSLQDEVRRLLIHGFLHLLGYDHEKGPYQNRKMRTKEQELAHALEALD